MSNGIVDNLLQGGTPPIFGPGPEPDLPNPRDIPEIIIKDQAAQQLGNIFDNAGITMINPNMVVDLADAVIDDELSLGEAFDIGVDSTIAGGINKAVYGIPGFGQAKAGFDAIKQIEAILGRPLLPAEISQFASGIFSLPNVITNRILNFRRGITDDDDTGGGTGGGTVIIGGQPTTTGVSGPAGMVVDPGAVSQSFQGRGGADRGGNVVIGGGADASQSNFTPGNIVIGSTTGTTPGPAGMGFIPPVSKKDRPPMGKAEGGLISLVK